MRRAGFTLMEMAMVLVIIGLLIGGIFVGRSMMKQAELQSILTGTEELKQQIQSFKLKYRSLPGDMRNATQFWGAADGSSGLTATCTNQDYEFSNPTDALTCNGDGDGLIAGSAGYDTSYEKYRLWEHLSNAEILTEKFTGSRSVEPLVNSIGVYPGVNIPETARTNVGYMLLYHGGGNGNQYDYPFKTGHYIVIGGGGWNLHWPDHAAFSAVEAAQVDAKIDDGKPGTGNMIVKKPYYTQEFSGAACASSNDEAVAVYVNSDSLNTNARGCDAWIYWGTL
jgi:prepilin-type N-terminal cleavage/methylation domain-containing protein